MQIKPSGQLAPTAAEERARVEAIFNSIGDGAIATDEFGKITRINPTALKILGHEEQELLGKWFPDAIINVDEQGTPQTLIDRPITRAFLTGTTITEKTYFQQKNGARIPVAVTVAPIIHNGRPIGAIEVFRDITQELEVDRMKSEFISLASHQLRTPLSAIKTYTHMLMEGYMGDTSPKQQRSLNTIVNAADRMNELISTLLNITRIESGSIAVSPKQVDLVTLTKEAIKELEHIASTKQLKVQVQYIRPVTAKTDAMIVKEILNNLLSNAIKYTEQGGKITVTFKDSAKQVVISVHDSGFGIPKSSQAQIFTKFFRAPNALQHETSGTGLGLYLVKGLAQQLGGKVWFKSEEHEGSVFYVSIPKA